MDIKIIIADDHTLVRAGIRSLLDTIKQVDVVAEANDGREAIQLIQKFQPDIVLMDIGMSGLNGLEATEIITRDHSDVKVIILSMHTSEEYVLQALRSGAAGYLVKDAAPNELKIAVESVSRGETYLSPVVSKHVIQTYIQRTRTDMQDTDTAKQTLYGREKLTSRQREILQLIAEGHKTKDIAAQLHVSVKTVETHRMQLMERLDIHDIAGLVRYAIRIGLISLDE